MKIGIYNTNEQFAKDPFGSDIFTTLGLGSHTINTSDLITVLFGNAQDELDFEASCVCGELVGNYYSPQTICPKCKTPVRTQFCDELSFRGWIDIEGVLGIPVLHPVVYNILHKWLGSISRVRVIDMLLDVNIELPPELSELGQGYKYFYNNFWNIIRFFENYKVKRKPQSIRPTLEILGKDIFISRLPILNSSLHVITQHGKMRLADSTSKHIISALTELSDVVYKNTTSVVKDSYIDIQLLSIYKAYLQYTHDVADTKVYQKPGIIRKNILGARLHLTIRGVITPITDQHTMDELHIPWKIGVDALKLEILNILTNRMGYSMQDAITIQAEALVSWDKRVADIFKILIAESPHRTLAGKPGLFVVFGRNPVLVHLSILALVITKIKNDIHDETIGITSKIAKYTNHDLTIIISLLPSGPFMERSLKDNLFNCWKPLRAFKTTT